MRMNSFRVQSQRTGLLDGCEARARDEVADLARNGRTWNGSPCRDGSPCLVWCGEARQMPTADAEDAEGRCRRQEQMPKAGAEAEAEAEAEAAAAAAAAAAAVG